MRPHGRCRARIAAPPQPIGPIGVDGDTRQRSVRDGQRDRVSDGQCLAGRWPETAACRFVELIADQAPSLPAVQGIFNGYGKVYCDMGHVVRAHRVRRSISVAVDFRTHAILATRAVEQLAHQGIELVLANNNHSGLLTSESPYWGSHENYLTERHPRMFGSSILPFLVTRLFHGAGGIHFPTGDYLAAVRPLCMQSAVGGGTTGSRAIHSTAREEHHMGPRPNSFRYHLLLADGHRSHFNLGPYSIGATALAIKAVLTR